jgi:hypothetical protein
LRALVKLKNEGDGRQGTLQSVSMVVEGKNEVKEKGETQKTPPMEKQCY